MTQERLSGERGADAGNASMNWLDPALIGNGSTPPTGGAHQDQEPPYGVSKEFRELGEALKPWGFRWPQAKPSPEGSAPGSAESLFLRARQSPVAYLNWRHSTRHQLRTTRLFLPKRRAAANADTSTTALPAGFYTPETLATYLGVSLSTIYSWNSSGYGPPFVKLGNLVRYTYEEVELWLARQLELSRG